MQEREISRFGEQLTLNGGDGRYEVQISELWSQGRACYGGLVGGLLTRAIEQVVPSERSLRSALIDFIAPAAPGAASIEVRVLREGRALSHAEARMSQDGQVVAVMVGAYGSARPSQLQLPGAPPEPTSPADQLPRMPYVDGIFPRFTQHFEYRLRPGDMLYSGSSKPALGGYIRHPHGGPVDAAGLLGLIDAWPPAVLPMLRSFAPASSVTWMVDFTGAAPVRGSESDAFYRYEAYGVAGSDGYGTCEARLWNERGELVAASRQLIVEFSKP